MQSAVIALCLLNFAFIGTLPLWFFSRGRFNLRWWLTAGPLFLAGGMLALALTGVWPATSWRGPVVAIAAAAVVLSLLSIGLIAYAISSHRASVALWHQSDQVPQQLVTGRAYRRVRHPLYLAFVLALLAALAAVPGLPMLLVVLVGLVALNLTARVEEKHLLASAHGDSYRRYMATTGRILPRWSRP